MSTALQIAEALQKQLAELRRDLLRPKQSTHLCDVIFREADAYAILKHKIETAAAEWYREHNNNNDTDKDGKKLLLLASDMRQNHLLYSDFMDYLRFGPSHLDREDAIGVYVMRHMSKAEKEAWYKVLKTAELDFHSPKEETGGEH